MIKLTMSANLNDESPVNFNEDQLAVIEKATTDIIGTLHSLKMFMDGGKFENSTRHAICGCLENYTSQLTTAMDYPSDLEKRRKEVSSEIRTANLEIKRLEDLVGSQRGFNGMPEAMSLMTQTFRDYWSKLGFSSVYDYPNYNAPGSSTGGGFSAASGHLYYFATCWVGVNSHLSDDDDKPVTSRLESNRKIVALSKKLDLVRKSHHEIYFLDTPKNRRRIEQSLKKRFPSLEVQGWDIKRMDDGRFKIQTLTIFIDNCEELLPNKREIKEREDKLKAWAAK